MQIKIPQKILDAARKTDRNLCLHGGRGGAKSESIARILLYEGNKSPKRILCCREFQNSIADSVHSLLSDIIKECNFSGYDVNEKYIKHKNGTEFLFRGLKKESVNGIKSLNKISVCWVEEAQYISRKSLDILIPTIREQNSKIIFTLNPENEDDPVYVDYVLADRPDTVKCLVNYYDNPWFPKELQRQIDIDRSTDVNKYLHIWEGHILKQSEAQIFKGKYVIDDFESPNMQLETFYYGSDWGFANDPTCLVRDFIKDNTLYIDYEVGGINIELDEIPAVFDKIEGSRRFWIKADSSRPETISYIKNKGFNIKPAEKWPGSVEDGIAFLKSFDKIVIHPRCKHTIDEFKLYSYKTDPKTGEILPIIVDKHNHYIDAIRYSQDGMIKRKTNILDRF
jgi:phage terminase large subunit